MVTVSSVHLRLNSFAMSTKMMVSPRAGPGVEALMKRFSSRIEFKPARQRSFEFLDRSRRRQRWFKLGILATTGLAIALLFGFVPKGRYIAASARVLATQTARSVFGIPTPRAEIDEGWRRFRLQGVADAERAMPKFFESISPEFQRLMSYAGLDPEHGLIRWGNYDTTLLLPSTVFEADDKGRSYRLRPCVEAIWLREITLRGGMLMFFLVPDGPGLAAAMRGTTAIPVEESRQSTNSWGLRGPEPDPDAPLRGLVLGDSFMQGMFIGDNDTPPECLRRDLELRLKTRVSMLNTGHLGYSPEQYYYSLVEYGDRFRPHFVVVSVFSNDFSGDIDGVASKGKGDWDEGKYWLDKIIQMCRSRGLTYLVVPVPYEPVLLGRRKAGNYPGALSNVLEENSLTFLDPSDDLLNAHLELVIAGERVGKRPFGCPLFNAEIRDGHFSAQGSKAWAETVGRRLTLLFEGNPAIPKLKN